MAIISIKKLYSILNDNKEFYNEWKDDVKPEQALWIKFDDEDTKIDTINQIELEASDGNQVIINKNKEGKVIGIEIV